jgi:hypothetical protein
VSVSIRSRLIVSLLIFGEDTLAAPRTKEAVLQQMRLIWFGFIIAIPLYAWVGETVQATSWLNFWHAGEVFGILAVVELFYFFWARKKLYTPALVALQNQPGDMHAVRRWMNSWIVLLCMANSMILFGLAFRLGSKTLQQSVPFYVVGSLLILWLWPRQVWSTPK